MSKTEKAQFFRLKMEFLSKLLPANRTMAFQPHLHREQTAMRKTPYNQRGA